MVTNRGRQVPSILFIHENFPAQFGGLAEYLGSRGWRVVFATANPSFEPGALRRVGSVDVVRYERARDPSGEHPYLIGTQKAVLNAQGFARTGAALAKGGFTPDVIVAHSGWGSGSFAKVVWPEAQLIQYLEWWYNHPALDVEPGQVRGPAEDVFARTLVRNLPFLLDFQQADRVIAPTRFQASQVPDFVQRKLVVQHDGVDCRQFRPYRTGDATFQRPGLPEDAPLVTFATRGMEPLRGFPSFMAAASQLQARHPALHVLVAGRDRSCYGAAPEGGKSYKQRALEQYQFDENRLHFVELLPKDQYARLLRRSNAHVYLTRPFVLSWSLIEAMASGCPLVVSDTAPTHEALPDGDGAVFVDMDDPCGIAEAALNWIKGGSALQEHRNAARARALAKYDTAVCYPALESIFLAQVDRVASHFGVPA